MISLRQSWVLLTIVVCVALLPIWQGRFYAVGDMRDVTIPLESFFHQEELQGRLPAWNPDAAFGFPVIASAQIGFFYPPLLFLRFLPLPIYVPLVLFLHIAATAIGTFLFLRALRFDSAAALFGSISFTLSIFIWQHITHFNIILAVAWLPWQFYMAKHLSSIPTWRAKHAIWFSFLIGLPFLIGQLQIQTLSALVVVTYLIHERRAKKYSLAMSSLLMVGVLAFGIAAAQLLPTYELSTVSSRGQGGSFTRQTANQHSFPLYHLPTIVFPRFFGSDNTYWGKRLEIEYGIAIGTIPFIVSCIAIWKKKTWRDPVYRFFTWAALVSFLLALGNLSPFRLIGLEPSLWIFSAPARWLFIYSFCMSILAAYGFSEVLTHITKEQWLRMLVALSMVVGIWNVGLYVFSRPSIVPFLLSTLEFSSPEKIMTVNEKVNSLLSSAHTYSMSVLSVWTYIPLLILLISFLTKQNLYHKYIILGITTIELLIGVVSLTPTYTWNDILSVPSVLQKLPENIQEGKARLYSVRDGGDTGAYFTDPSSRANTSIRQLQRNLFVPLLNAQFKLPGAEWPASLDIQPVTNALSAIRGEEGYDIQDSTALKNLNIGAVLIPESMSATIPGTLTGTQQDVAVYEVDAKPRIEFISQKQTQRTSQLEYQYSTPSTIDIKIDTPDEGKLIVRDTFYPGWHATLDGISVPITMMSPFFRAIDIPEGSHTIQFFYKPTTLFIGLSISLMTIIGCCAMLVTRKQVTL